MRVREFIAEAALSIRKRMRAGITFFFICFLLISCKSESDGQRDLQGGPGKTVVPPVDLVPPPWPEWVLTQWVWEDESTQQSAMDLIAGYKAHGVPLGAIIIDSPWETGYNTFDFDKGLYPDPAGMIKGFHDMGVRVFLWIVSMINVDSPNYAFAKEQGYFIRDRDGEDFLVEWWKGTGSLLDYTNPEALAWWHVQMDNVLNMGIDGWKTDGTDFSGFLLDLLQGGMYGDEGRISAPLYQDLYYRDFFAYTRARLGPDRVITARPVDSYGTCVQLPFAPGDVNYAAWVGDQDPTFSGLRNALYNMFASAGKGKSEWSDKDYVNVGSDIGGYRGDDLRDRELFVRWAQLGAFSPVMENGGSGEHRPWMYDEEVLDIYTEYACLHHQLIPYLYSQGALAYEQGLSLLVPHGNFVLMGNKWNYTLGDALFVSAITEEGGACRFSLPEGEWIHLGTGVSYEGGRRYAEMFSLSDYPVFLRRGGLLPVEGSAECEDRGFEVPEGMMGLVVYPDVEDTFLLYEERGNGAEIRYTMDRQEMMWEISACSRSFYLRIREAPQASSISVDPWGSLVFYSERGAFESAQTGWFTDTQNGDLLVKPGPAEQGLRVVILWN